MTGSNFRRGTRQLKCQACGHVEKRCLITNEVIVLEKLGESTNPRCSKCGGTTRSGNYTGGARQLMCRECGHSERRALGSDEIIPARKAFPKCPICDGRARRFSHTVDGIKLRCNTSVLHMFLVEHETLKFVRLLDEEAKKEKPPKPMKQQKKERQPKPQKLTPEEKAVIKQSLTTQKEAKRLAGKVYARTTALASPQPNKAEIKAVRQREKLMREKIEDQREARIQRDPLFDFD